MLCNRTSLGERQPLLSLVARVFSFIDNQSSVSVGNRSSLLQRIANRYFSTPVGSPRDRVI